MVNRTSYCIVGMRHQPEECQKLVEKLKIGDILWFKRELENAHSNYAVAVYADGNSGKIGYLKEEHAQDFCDLGKGRAIARITRKCTYYLTAELEENTVSTIPGRNTSNNTTAIGINSIAHEYPAAFKITQEKTLMNKIVDSNVSQAKSAAVLEAGRIANNQAVKLVSAQAPLMLKGYVDTPFGKIVLANLAQMAAQKMRPLDKRLAGLTNAMGLMAYQELVQTFDIEKMINDMLASETIKNALATFDADSV